MKISELIAKLRSVHDRFGDLDVVVGEVSGILRSRLDVNVDDVEFDGEGNTIPTAIVQGYVLTTKPKGQGK